MNVTEQSIADLVRDFENAAIEPGTFGHEAHIKVGWWYLQRCELLEAIHRFTDAIGRLTRLLGVTDKYHETITWFYLIKIAERLSGREPSDWESFCADNPDLFTWNPGLLQRYYTDELLQSARARQAFVLPDRLDNGEARAVCPRAD